MPKTRSRVPKKGKVKTLTRGRQKPVVNYDEDTDSESGEDRPTSPESKNTEGSFVASSPASVTSSVNAKDPREEPQDERKDGEKKEPGSAEDIGDLIEDFKTKGKFNYVTEDLAHRDFELNARKYLVQLRVELDLLKDYCTSSVTATRKLCPEVKLGRLSDLLKLDSPMQNTRSVTDLIVKLCVRPRPESSVLGSYTKRPLMSIQEHLCEEEEEEYSSKTTAYTVKYAQPRFPSPSKMPKYMTPKQDVFHFGAATLRSGLSTNKAPRPAKPGEVVYSEGGSPILSRRVPDRIDSTQPHERVVMMLPDGTKAEVDLVYRGTHETDKLKEFQEFTREVRNIAATRSTVKRDRVQPPRINVKGSGFSSTKKKPEWR